ncbi:MAG TPA: hypothetical protein ENH85_13240 [Candidatus Scalindua sp.]|nr:hypothetical protein [Candidatus Scalindua sp.]
MSKCKFKSIIKKRIRISTDFNEKGMILIAALALISILALMATLSVTTTYTEIKISSNYKTSVQASYAVEAGYEEARARLRGSPSDPIYAGDPAASPDPAWSAYILTSDTWEFSTDPNDNNYFDPNYKNYIPLYDPVNHINTATETNTIQEAPYISYWVKIRHKKWSDCTAAEQATVDTSNTSVLPPSDPLDIIYYGYPTSTATTAVPFTSDNDPSNASPVDIITSYGGSGGKSSSIIEVQTRKLPGPPIVAAVYGDQEVHLHGDDVNITGDDVCASADSVPAVAYVNEVKLHDTYTLTSDAGATTQITALDLAVIIDELEPIATVILTGDQTNYSVGSSSNYEVVYCDATQLSGSKLKLENVTGYGILVVRGKIEFKKNTNWNGLIIASLEIKFDDNTFGTINGAILSADKLHIKGEVDVYYSSCELDKAKSNFRHPTSKWKVGG